ncbi:MAG: hypothetical protein QNJ63_19175 [Calothrix sp. MO_192.B10]|nr:hypothetical protein [Calothrix sp. MO_192.B10]
MSKNFLKLIITATALGLGAYFLATNLDINAKHIPYLQEIMYATIAVGLYINIVSIDTTIFKSNLDSIFKVIFLGVPLKIILPGFLLAYLSPSVAPIAYLCATVIAQIDPIAAAHSLDYSNISKKSETILRAWSSFDDPITVLFAFYIFRPIILLVDFNFNEYLFRIVRDITTCFIVYFIYKQIYRKYSKKLPIPIKYKIKFKIFLETITIIGIIIYSILSASFLLPAAIGLFIRPFAAEKLTKINSAIFYFSVIILGLLSANLSLDWNSGLILAFSTFFLAQVLVTLLFLKDSTESKTRVMFGHQNGMTAMLLTVAIEVSGSEKTAQLLSVTLPAIICIAIFYFASNYILDILIPSSLT